MSNLRTTSRRFTVIEFVDRFGQECSYDECSIVMIVDEEGATEPRAKSELFPVERGDILQENICIRKVSQ